MPRCYLLALCSGSSLDVNSNNLSLFNLVEQIQFRAGALTELTIPLEVHSYWSIAAGELGREYEARWVACGPDGIEVLGRAFPLRADSLHLRIRVFGINIPAVSGMCETRIEWRAADGIWTREPVTWPIALASID